MARGATSMWAWGEIRARWRSLIALGLLIGVTAGFAMAATAGARRTDTVVARLRDRTNAADAVVFATQVRFENADWAALARQPEVDAVAPWALAVGVLNGQPDQVIMGPTDDQWLQQVDRPIVIVGRMWNPDADDETIIDEYAAEEAGVHLGDVIKFHAYSPDQRDETETAAPAGPDLDLKVVGIVRVVNQYLFAPLVMMSPGVIAQHGDQMAYGTNAMVQLHNDSADIPALQRDVNEKIVDGVPLLDLHEAERRVSTTFDVEAGAQRLLALAIALAGGILVAQALSRSVAMVRRDAPVLRAVGFSRGGMTVASFLAHVPALGVAIATAVVTAIAASHWFPVGFASEVEPDPGLHADWFVLAVGSAVTALLVVAAIGFVSYRAVRPARAERTRAGFGIADAFRRRAPVSVGIGTTMVLERGRDRAAVPVRPAIVGAIVGVVGIAATMTINAGLNDAFDHPERAGVVFDAAIDPPDNAYTATGLRQDFVDDVASSADIDAAAVAFRQPLDVNGVGVPAFTVAQPTKNHGGRITFTTVDGRAPERAGEVSIGPATARDLGVHIGDTVRVGKLSGLRVVGRSLFPHDVHAEFDEGLWLVPEQFDTVAPTDMEQQTGPQRYVLVRFADGLDDDAARAALGERLGEHALGVYPPDTPPELLYLHKVRTLPVFLAVFLGLLAIAAMLHVLMTLARSRAPEFAVLRAMGMTRRSTRFVSNVQGSLLGVIGLLIGVPLGIVLGRVIWTEITRRVPIEDVPPFAGLALALVIPVALLVANALAVWPGRRAARLRPAEVLRSE